MSEGKNLLQYLISVGAVTQEAQEAYQGGKGNKSSRILRALVEKGLLAEDTVVKAAVAHLGAAPLFRDALEESGWNEELLESFPRFVALEDLMIPLWMDREGQVITVAAFDPSDQDTLEAVRLFSQMELVEVMVAPLSALADAAKRMYKGRRSRPLFASLREGGGRPGAASPPRPLPEEPPALIDLDEEVVGQEDDEDSGAEAIWESIEESEEGLFDEVGVEWGLGEAKREGLSGEERVQWEQAPEEGQGDLSVPLVPTMGGSLVIRDPLSEEDLSPKGEFPGEGVITARMWGDVARSEVPPLGEELPVVELALGEEEPHRSEVVVLIGEGESFSRLGPLLQTRGIECYEARDCRFGKELARAKGARLVIASPELVGDKVAMGRDLLSASPGTGLIVTSEPTLLLTHASGTPGEVFRANSGVLSVALGLMEHQHDWDPWRLVELSRLTAVMGGLERRVIIGTFWMALIYALHCLMRLNSSRVSFQERLTEVEDLYALSQGLSNLQATRPAPGSLPAPLSSLCNVRARIVRAVELHLMGRDRQDEFSALIARAEALEAQLSSGAVMSARRLRVLIIDPDLEPWIPLIRRLQEDGVIVETLNDAEDIVEMLKNTHVDLVIMSINLPTMDGFSLLSWSRSQARLRGLTFIFTAADVPQGIEAQALEMGAKDFLYKPLEMEMVYHRVRRVLRRSEGEPRSPRPIEGEMEAMSLPHLLLAVEANLPMAQVRASQEGEELRASICTGRLIHLQVGDQGGVRALSSLSLRRGGPFVVLPLTLPTSSNIDIDVYDLL